MYSNTRFSLLLKGLPQHVIETFVNIHQGDKHSKGFRCRDQLLAMIYGQISGARSLRELEAGFNSQASAHYHLGTRPVKRTTLADANAKRSHKLFEDICVFMLQQAHRQTRRELQDLLYLIDSTPIGLKGLNYDCWTKENATSRTQGLKVHMMMEANHQVPTHAEITAPNVNDIDAGRRVKIETGATYVFDKGYYDYNWWNQINDQNAYFVTRLKKNAGINVLSQQVTKDPLVLEDATIGFKNKRPGGKRINHYHGKKLRRVIVERPDKATPLVLVTNDFMRSAREIADLYKQRWGIELFFKWLKQNLKIKQFFGRSENAVRIQIYTAIITYLLAHISHQSQNTGQTLRLWLAELKTGLFQRPETDQRAVKKRRREDEIRQRLQGALAL